EPSPFTNAAVRQVRSFVRVWDAGDVEAVETAQAATQNDEDSRSLMQLTMDREGLDRDDVHGLEAAFHAGAKWHVELMGTRGDRLALFGTRIVAPGTSAGESEWQRLTVVDVDAGGRRIGTVVFDGDDVDAAFAELDQRFTRGEAANFPAWAALRGDLEG